jgi:UDP-N-acetylglucosamine--N-acetylmuramyl-(pentapeptide) pyrophosphoryl-undecaprenol N-acetylglucosamine transferase
VLAEVSNKNKIKRRNQLLKPDQNIRVIISGGGTGGHIFPAISIADEFRKQDPGAEILFVGAIGRMEMERVPAAGYKIIGLPISGIQRRLSYKNFVIVFNIIRSLFKARKIIDSFKPHIAIGVGGYASGPLLRIASKKGIPTLLQEQNSYAGVTNKLLARKASKICVAYSGMEKYFPTDKIVITGNPVRNIQMSDALRNEAYTYFDLERSLPVVLILGGSLGAKTINESLLEKIEQLNNSEIQIVWQTGKHYYDSVKEKVAGRAKKNIHVYDFISRMDLAYNIADLMISRAGAISISEICLTGQAVILIPSPNVAEDHQTKNALALVKEHAAVMVKDQEARKILVDKMMELIKNTELRKELSFNSKKMAKPKATSEIVEEALKILRKEN